MKLEAGKYYKTRDGRKAKIVSEISPSPFNHTVSTYPFMGWVEGYTAAISWTAQGSYIEQDWSKADSDSDLVAEWKEPVKVEGWVNVYPHGFTRIRASREIADNMAGAGRITCVYVSGEEDE